MSRHILIIFLITCWYPAHNLFAGQLQDSTLYSDTLLARRLLIKQKDFLQTEEYPLALEALQQAQQLYSKYELWTEAINCEIDLATLADNFDGSALKIKHANRALQLANQHLEINHSLFASAYRQQAEALMMQGKLDSANYFLNLAVPIFKNNQEWPDLGWSEVLIAVNCLNQNQTDEAAEHFEKINLLLKQKVLVPDEQKEIHATWLDLRGVLFQMQGDYEQAITNSKEALAINLQRKYLTSQDSSFVATLYNNLAAFYITKGDQQRALDNFNQVNNYDKKAMADPVLLNNIGQALIRQKKYTEAIDYFEQCLLLTNGKAKRNRLHNRTLNNLAICHRDLGNYEKALDYCQLSLKKSQGATRYMAQRILGNIYIKNNKPELALPVLTEAAEAVALDSSSSNQNSTYNKTIISYLLGNAYVLNKDPARALKFFQEALVNNHNQFKDSLAILSNPSLSGIYDPIYFLKTLRAKAKTLATFEDQVQQLNASLSTYQLCIQWMDSLHTSYPTETSQLDWSAHFKPIYEEAIQVAYTLYQQTLHADYLNLAFGFSEKSKNAILLETLKSKEGKSVAAVPDSLIQKEKDLNLDIAYYEKAIRKIKTSESNKKVKLYQQYLSSKRLALNNLKEEMALLFPKYHDWKYGGQSPTIATIQNELANSKTAVLEYFIGDSTAFVFVISKNNSAIYSLSSPQRIINAITNYRELLLTPGAIKTNARKAFQEYNETANLVYQLILQEPLKNIPGAIDQLIIVPDGILNALPFAALCKNIAPTANIDFAALPYLLYDYQVQYAYSANLLLNNQKQRASLPANSECLAFAPAYRAINSQSPRGQFEQLRTASGQLPGAASEIQKISNYLDGKFSYGSEATELQFKRLAPKFGILHLAMHGEVDLGNANFNHLKFSDLESNNLEDNLLHHFEIANMSLQAQLVVLSACETGIGKYKKGEGVFSLARSFMYAGVPSVVMSLWKVSDTGTSQLMPNFYEGLAAGQDKARAMSEAKLRYLQEVDLEYRHPYYWSAFVVMGDAQKLKIGSHFFVWMGIAGFLLFSIAWFSRQFWLSKSKN